MFKTKHLKVPAWQAIIVFPLLFTLCSLRIPRVVLAHATDEVYPFIRDAEEAITSAFEAVLEAEEAGGNVSRLIVRLNEAAGLLSDAKSWFINGDFDESIELAANLVEIADVVRDEASTLKISALEHREFVFIVSLVASMVGVPAFLFFMLLLWRRFKSHYMRKILSLRPEAAKDAEA